MLARRSNAQRQEIIKQYKTMFGKDLVRDLKSELSGEFWKVVRALCLTPAEYDATELRNAIKVALNLRNLCKYFADKCSCTSGPWH